MERLFERLLWASRLMILVGGALFLSGKGSHEKPGSRGSAREE